MEHYVDLIARPTGDRIPSARSVSALEISRI